MLLTTKLLPSTDMCSGYLHITYFHVFCLLLVIVPTYCFFIFADRMKDDSLPKETAHTGSIAFHTVPVLPLSKAGTCIDR